jgi:hypothetical protein
MGISSAKDARLKNSYGGSSPVWTTPFGFLGNIYNTMLYNRALTALEVLQNFNALRGRYGI